jgi:hypothetical protein
MKDLYDSTVLESLYISLNRELPKKYSLYLPQIKHSSGSASYGCYDNIFLFPQIV